MMFCRKCGKQIDDSDNFCRHCGHGTSSVPPASNPVTVKNVYSGKDTQILGLVVFLSCGAMAVVVGNGTMRFVFLLGAIAGLVVYSVGRFTHWYHAE